MAVTNSDTFGELGSSFVAHLAAVTPDVLPRVDHTSPLTATATTLVAASFEGGVVMAGDRRATMGNVIAQRDIQKVFAADEYSLIGIAGAAGIATEMVRLFQVELQHYDKIEGASLSLDGKANRLSAMIRGNLSMAMQGLAVIPLFAGWDQHRGEGRIFSYDATGGRYEELAFHSVGSGSAFARGSLKKLYRPQMSVEESATVCIQALFDAADDDSATGGPDLTRAIYPVIWSASEAGTRKFSEDEVAALTEGVVGGRMKRPDGPEAGLL